MPTVIEEIAAERERQKTKEQWSDAHDDEHTGRELAKAAACYATHASRTDYGRAAMDTPPPRGWPWEWKWWKPYDRRRDLVRAAALIVAEIERIDRKDKKDRA